MNKPILLGAFILLLSIAMVAHPADDIQIEYDGETYLLTLKIHHPSQDFDKHYIEKIWITVNGQRYLYQRFNSQDDSDGITLTYKIFNVERGTVITVDTKCNVFGKKTAKLVIE
jgi:hypothetical protein